MEFPTHFRTEYFDSDQMKTPEEFSAGVSITWPQLKKHFQPLFWSNRGAEWCSVVKFSFSFDV